MAEKLTLTIKNIIRLDLGLAALDGDRDKDGKIVTRYDFDESTSWNIAKNRKIVDDALDTYTVLKKNLAAKYSVIDGMNLTEKNAPLVAAYIAGDEKLQANKVELNGILKIDRKVLHTQGVKVPGVIANLMPVLNDK